MLNASDPVSSSYPYPGIMLAQATAKQPPAEEGVEIVDGVKFVKGTVEQNTKAGYFGGILAPGNNIKSAGLGIGKLVCSTEQKAFFYTISRRLYQCTLNSPVEIDGHRFIGNSTLVFEDPHYDPDHQTSGLISAVLRDDQAFGGSTFRAGTTMYFDVGIGPDLPKPTLLLPTEHGPKELSFGNDPRSAKMVNMIDWNEYFTLAVPSAKGTYNGFEYDAGSSVLFREEDEKKEYLVMTLSRDEKITGQDLPAGTTVAVYDKKYLDKYYLASDKNILGSTFKAGSTVNMDLHDGVIKSVSILSPHTVQGTLCGPGEVEFFANGKIRSYISTNREKIYGNEFPTGTTILFARDGRVKGAAEPNKGFTMRGVKYHEVIFYPSGKLVSGVLAEDTKVQGVPLHARSMFTLFESGRLDRVLLTTDTVIGGKEYLEGKVLFFDEKTGEIMRVLPSYMVGFEDY